VTGAAITISNGTDAPTVLPLDDGIITTSAEPGKLALGWAGDRLVTLDLSGATPEWLDDLVREVYEQRRRAAVARRGLQQVCP
jgi:hypothetical protein